MAEHTLGQEIFRLLKVAREAPAEGLLDEALAGRPKTSDTVSKLMSFIVKQFGQENAYTGRRDQDSIVTTKIGDACSEFLAEAGVDAKTIKAIRYPNPTPGTKSFRSVLPEFEEF
jgi:hypothetical protein